MAVLQTFCSGGLQALGLWDRPFRQMLNFYYFIKF